MRKATQIDRFILHKSQSHILKFPGIFGPAFGFNEYAKTTFIDFVSCLPNCIRPEVRNRPDIGWIDPPEPWNSSQRRSSRWRHCLASKLWLPTFRGAGSGGLRGGSFPGEPTARYYLSESGGESRRCDHLRDARHSGEVCQRQGALTIRRSW